MRIPNLKSAAILLVGIYLLKVAALDKLGYYAHPRFHLFTIVMAIIAVAGLLGGLIYRYRNSDHHHEEKQIEPSLLIQIVIIVVPAIIGLLTEPAVLSSATAINRSGSTPVSTDDTDSISFNSLEYDIFEWALIQLDEPDLSQHVGKEANVSGFIIDAFPEHSDLLRLARFRISCCAIDATPVSIVVNIPNWREELRADQWLEIEGAMNTVNINGKEELVIETETYTNIEIPNDPYIY